MNCCYPDRLEEFDVYPKKDNLSPSQSVTDATECHSKERRYCELDANGKLRSRKLTAYECQLEDDVERLQEALFTISSHYARIQFRLRQVACATGCERMSLLRELERMTSQGLDGKFDEGGDVMPSLKCDSESMGNVREKQYKIINQLRGRLQNLAEASEMCFQTEQDANFQLNKCCTCSQLRASMLPLDETDDLTANACFPPRQSIQMETQQNKNICNCRNCKARREQAAAQARLKQRPERYLSETWPAITPEPGQEKQRKRKKSKHSKGKKKSKSAKSRKTAMSAYRNLGVGGSKTQSARSGRYSGKQRVINCNCPNRRGYPIPYPQGKLPDTRGLSVKRFQDPVRFAARREERASRLARGRARFGQKQNSASTGSSRRKSDQERSFSSNASTQKPYSAPLHRKEPRSVSEFENMCTDTPSGEDLYTSGEMNSSRSSKRAEHGPQCKCCKCKQGMQEYYGSQKPRKYQSLDSLHSQDSEDDEQPKSAGSYWRRAYADQLKGPIIVQKSHAYKDKVEEERENKSNEKK